jgi:hypothetical protein
VLGQEDYERIKAQDKIEVQIRHLNQTFREMFATYKIKRAEFVSTP